MAKSALIYGATGLVGSHLLELLIDDDKYDRVHLASRRSSKTSSPKVKEHLGDLLDKSFYDSLPAADDIFICVGTTRAKTSDLSTYRAIDYGIPSKAAEQAQKHQSRGIYVVSSMGADPKAKGFYLKIKGQMEEAVLAAKIPHTYIFRPSLIMGDRSEFRLGEGIAKFLARIFSFLIPLKYRGVEAIKIARAMQAAAHATAASQTKFVESDEIQKF
jgi:uncharacterized protein YbjT (DUF2867 family)